MTARSMVHEALEQITKQAPNGQPATTRLAQPGPSVFENFTEAQALNTTRHTVALRPFRREEFGAGPAAPSEAHIQAANQLMLKLRHALLKLAGQVNQAAEISGNISTTASLQALLIHKQRAGQRVKLLERIWNYYFELFGQRHSRVANWLLASDRIARNCYQEVYMGLGVAKSIPSPPPLSYMETGFTPATFRRGVLLTKLGRQANPFPVIQLPYHRLVNPWTLGAVHHEVSHNIQNDLGLWQEVPRRIYHRLRQAGLEARVAGVWARWHKEIWADLCGLLLGGPAVVASLLDVVAMPPASAQAFSPTGVHPIPYLRVLINLELLSRMGFPAEAEAFRQLWARIYPSPRAGTIPQMMLNTFLAANRLVVDTICFQPCPQLGDKSLAEVVRFTPAHQEMIQEAGQRIAAGIDPGIIPARFLVGAARWAVDNRLAPPEQITRNFYQELSAR